MMNDFCIENIEASIKEVNIANFTWFKVGGKCRMYTPQSIDELAYFLKQNKEKIHIIGNGSNTLIRDGGFDGIVIRMSKLNTFEIDGLKIYAQSGVLSSKIAKSCAENGIGGLEFLSGIPGNMGGIVKMNAGCYGDEIFNFIEKIVCINNGEIFEISKSDLSMEYRNSNIDGDNVIVGVYLKGKPDKSDNIQNKIDNISKKRIETQPVKAKTSGSTFKNGENYSAWELINKAGLSGYEIGGARVSTMHNNFIENFNDATANDIENLVNHIINVVDEKFGVKLVPEIKIIGNLK